MTRGGTSKSVIRYCTFPQVSPLRGEIEFPGDKSVSHRALLLAAMAEGSTLIRNPSNGSDVASLHAALNQLGIATETTESHDLLVQGQGLYGFKKPRQALDMGNSGTAMRLLPGILVNQSFDSTLIGDVSLSKRPMQRIVDPLRLFGAQISASADGCAPLYITSSQNPLQGIEYVLPVASAQVKSCLLLAALYAKTTSYIIEKCVTRDHTEHLFTRFGIPLLKKGLMSEINSAPFKAIPEIVIPGDPSSAAFFIAAATLVPGSDILIRDIMINPTRMGFIRVLQKMGANIDVMPKTVAHTTEPVADIRVRFALLQGITVSQEEVVDMIDEFPIFFIVAACSKGTTEVRGIQELRYKETDRVAVMTEALTDLGIAVIELSDGICIEGGKLSGGIVHSRGDHRIAMALSIAGLVAQEVLFIEECDNVSTSFPGFPILAQELGLSLKVSAGRSEMRG